MKGDLKRWQWGWVVLVFAVFLLVRLRWVPHLLTWDEAMNLCTMRSFVTGADDAFSSWFWRHPPLFCLMMSALAPLSAGFAERVEILAVMLNAATMGVLFLLNRRVFGKKVALWSIVFFAVIPGNVFFDVWVKRDHGVALFGLLGLLLLYNRKYLYSGLCMGVAMLFKETAIFYLIAGGLMWLTCGAPARRIRDLVGWIIAIVLTSSWWYIGFEHVGEHFRFGAGGQAGWVAGGSYYLNQLIGALGYPGGILLLCGLLIAVSGVGRYIGRTRDPALFFRRAWPVYLIVPSYLLLSLVRAKVPWVIMSLFAGWATLMAIAADVIVAAGESEERPGLARIQRIMGVGLAILTSVAMFASAWFQEYEDILRSTDEGQWRGSRYSKELAEMVNSNVSDGERILITSFHYWKGIVPGAPCAVFAYYLDVDCAFLLCSHVASFEELWRNVVQYDIDWALLSPEPGPHEIDMFGGFDRATAAEPLKAKQGWLFRIEAGERH